MYLANFVFYMKISENNADFFI